MLISSESVSSRTQMEEENMIDRGELKSRGMAAFKNNYWPCVGAGLLTTIAAGTRGGGGYRSSGNYGNPFSTNGSSSQSTEEVIITVLIVLAILLVATLVIMAISLAIKSFLLGPLEVGCRKYWVNNADGCARGEDLLFGFKCGSYMNIVKVTFFKTLFIMLWSLLLWIPGVIKSYEWFMVPYLLAEDPTLTWAEAKEKSSTMMDGYKMDTFILLLSFIGWQVLSLFTCGILSIFYVNPYYYATQAELYMYLDGSANYGAGMSANYGGQNYGSQGFDDQNFSNPNYTSQGYTPNNNNGQF